MSIRVCRYDAPFGIQFTLVTLVPFHSLVRMNEYLSLRRGISGSDSSPGQLHFPLLLRLELLRNIEYILCNARNIAQFTGWALFHKIAGTNTAARIAPMVAWSSARIRLVCNRRFVSIIPYGGHFHPLHCRHLLFF